MRTLILLLAVFSLLGSPVVYAKGGPSPISALGMPSAERCKEVAIIAEKVASNPDAMPGRPPRRLMVDAMRCAEAEKAKAKEEAETAARTAPSSLFKKFLNVFGI